MRINPMFREVITTDKDVHFTGALAQYAVEAETLVAGTYGVSAGFDALEITKIKCQSDQQLIWRLHFSTSSLFDDTDLDVDDLDDYCEFDMVADGELYANANQYRLTKIIEPTYLYKSVLEGSFYLVLENLSSTAKIAGATGEIIFEIEGQTALS